jgi:hypothetical protein
VRFHVTKNREGKPLDLFIRVNSPVPTRTYERPAGCECKQVYPVVMQSVGVEHVKQGARVDGRRKFVCECHGGIVP